MVQKEYEEHRAGIDSFENDEDQDRLNLVTLIRMAKVENDLVAFEA